MTAAFGVLALAVGNAASTALARLMWMVMGLLLLNRIAILDRLWNLTFLMPRSDRRGDSVSCPGLAIGFRDMLLPRLAGIVGGLVVTVPPPGPLYAIVSLLVLLLQLGFRLVHMIEGI